VQRDSGPPNLLASPRSRSTPILLAREAARDYGRLGWRLSEATALELAGDLAEADAAYLRCGASYDASRLAAGQKRKLKRSPFGAGLTPRELAVAGLVAREWSDKDIARALGVSVRTVHHHVAATFSKLGLRARWQLTEQLLATIRTR
jgi:DNA-binding NarL/FixJ family response regulator